MITIHKLKECHSLDNRIICFLSHFWMPVKYNLFFLFDIYLIIENMQKFIQKLIKKPTYYNKYYYTP